MERKVFQDVTKNGHTLLADHNKPVVMILGSIFLACMVCNLIYFVLAYLIRLESPGTSLIFVAAGICGVGLFGWLGFWYILALFQKNPAFVMTEEGFYDNSEPWSPGFVPWSEVKSITARRFLFWKVLIFDLYHRDGIISRQKSIIKKVLFKTRFPIILTNEVHVRVNTLTKPMMGELLRRAGKNRQNISFFLE